MERKCWTSPRYSLSFWISDSRLLWRADPGEYIKIPPGRHAGSPLQYFNLPNSQFTIRDSLLSFILNNFIVQYFMGKDGKWICVFCGEENEDSNLKCKSCGEPRFEIKQKNIKKDKIENAEENKQIFSTFLKNKFIKNLKKFKNPLIKFHSVFSLYLKSKIAEILTKIKKRKNTKDWYKPSFLFYILIFFTGGIFLWAQGIYLNKYDKSPYLSLLNFLHYITLFFIGTIITCILNNFYISDDIINFSIVILVIITGFFVIYLIKRKPKSEKIRFNLKYLISSIITIFIISLIGLILIDFLIPSIINSLI